MNKFDSEMSIHDSITIVQAITRKAQQDMRGTAEAGESLKMEKILSSVHRLGKGISAWEGVQLHRTGTS